jgi:hypothetical protein
MEARCWPQPACFQVRLIPYAESVPEFPFPFGRGQGVRALRSQIAENEQLSASTARILAAYRACL